MLNLSTGVDKGTSTLKITIHSLKQYQSQHETTPIYPHDSTISFLFTGEIILIYSAWIIDATNLNSIDHGADSIFCDVIKAQLKGRHHHPGLQLAPRG